MTNVLFSNKSSPLTRKQAQGLNFEIDTYEFLEQLKGIYNCYPMNALRPEFYAESQGSGPDFIVLPKGKTWENRIAVEVKDWAFSFPSWIFNHVIKRFLGNWGAENILVAKNKWAFFKHRNSLRKYGIKLMSSEEFYFYLIEKQFTRNPYPYKEVILVPSVNCDLEWLGVPDRELRCGLGPPFLSETMFDGGTPLNIKKLSRLQKAILKILYEAYLKYRKEGPGEGIFCGGIFKTNAWNTGLTWLVAKAYGERDKHWYRCSTDEEIRERYEKGEITKEYYEGVMSIRRFTSQLPNEQRKEAWLTPSFRVAFSRAIESLKQRKLIENHPNFFRLSPGAIELIEKKLLTLDSVNSL